MIENPTEMQANMYEPALAGRAVAWEKPMLHHGPLTLLQTC